MTHEFKTKFSITCPYCGSKRAVQIYESVPVNKVDCSKCGAVADVHFIKNIPAGKTWSVEWRAA